MSYAKVIMPIVMRFLKGENPIKIIKDLINPAAQHGIAKTIADRTLSFKKRDGVKQIVYMLITRPVMENGILIYDEAGQFKQQLYFQAVEILEINGNPVIGEIIETITIPQLIDLIADEMAKEKPTNKPGSNTPINA